jgi:murein DD-endopeptidase MepM/ murein hydrolase activator NlpD
MSINSMIICIALHFGLLKGEAKQTNGYLPVAEGRISSHFGERIDPFHRAKRFHSGVDIAAKEGSEVRSIGAGVVAFSGSYRGFGNIIVVDHGRNLTTHYAHCLDTQVRVGQRVTSGEPIGFVGRSGRATGSHLQFELRLHGKPIDPKLILGGSVK